MYLCYSGMCVLIVLCGHNKGCMLVEYKNIELSVLVNISRYLTLYSIVI
jgi:hypothetical protein